MTGPGPEIDDGGWRPAARRFRVSGRVQGVGYRAYAARAARTLGLLGGARNLDDGRVEVLAAGAVHALDRFESALREGPRLARVSGVEVEPLSAPPPPQDIADCDVEF